MSTAPTAPDAFADALADPVTPPAYLDAAHRAVVHAATLAPSVDNSDGWTPAAALADLPDGTALGVVLAGRPVCLVRSQGTVHALLDECSHGQVQLSEGDVDGGFVECWLHGSRFDLTTGRPTGPPATAPVPVYPVRIVAGTVEIQMPASTDNRTAR